MRKLKASHTPLFTAWPAAHKLSLPGTQGKEREGGQTAASCNESLAPPLSPPHPRPLLPREPASLLPARGNVCLATLASLTEKAILWGRGGLLLQKLLPWKSAKQLPARAKHGDSAQQLDGNTLLQAFSTNTT